MDLFTTSLTVWHLLLLALWDTILFLVESSCVSACAVGVAGGCFTSPQWVGHSFIIHHVVLHTGFPLLFVVLNY